MTFSFTAPGTEKRSRRFQAYFSLCLSYFKKNFGKRLAHLQTLHDDAGYQGIFAPRNVEGPEALKEDLIRFERIGIFKLSDIDVISRQGPVKRISEPRRCVICGSREMRGCFLSGKHTAVEVLSGYDRVIERAFLHNKIRRTLKERIRRALLSELCTTPKYGMIDMLDSSRHSDMNFRMFLDSIETISGRFGSLYDLGFTYDKPPNTSTIADIRLKGRGIEREMFKRTGGVNTLKGAVFLYSVICFSLGYIIAWKEKPSLKALIGAVKNICRGLEKELRDPGLNTASGEVFRKYGIGGIRSELKKGLPSVITALRKKYPGAASINEIALRRFLTLFKNTDDTQVIKRTGLEEYRRIQEALDPSAGNIAREMDKFGKYASAHSFSAGGTADLLSLSFFLDPMIEDLHK